MYAGIQAHARRAGVSVGDVGPRPGHADPPFGTPRTMTVRLVADIQNRLFWRVGTSLASAIVRRWCLSRGPCCGGMRALHAYRLAKFPFRGIGVRHVLTHPIGDHRLEPFG
jgi:hypothetical protein